MVVSSLLAACLMITGAQAVHTEGIHGFVLKNASPTNMASPNDIKLNCTGTYNQTMYP
jgi:hypothetical protein